LRINYAFVSKAIHADEELLRFLRTHNLVDYRVGNVIYIKPAETLQLLVSVEKEKEEMRRLKQIESNYSKVREELEKSKEEYKKAQKEYARLNDLYKKAMDDLNRKEAERKRIELNYSKIKEELEKLKEGYAKETERQP